MSHIKGGGRAPLSEETEEALVSLLLSLRRPDLQITSDHVRKREHRQFLKKLQNRHDRRSLAQKINQSINNDLSSASTAPETVTEQLEVLNNTTRGPPENRKVRVELVEAVFPAAGKANKKGGGSGKDFKEGNKKVMVLALSTTAQDLLKEAKAKLRMKKKPTMCFVVEKKISMELVGDLRGLKDGIKIYVTAGQQDKKQQSAKEKEKKDETKQEGVEEDSSKNKEEDDDEPDPLDAVKAAYVKRKRQRSKPNQQNTSKPKVYDHPRFADHFEKLIPLPAERANLPAAASRKTILQSLDGRRVLIVCGATGCGKSTQIPQFLLEGMTAAGKKEAANIMVTQPRRVAAMALASRVSTEMQCPEPGKKGSEVGYVVRLDRRVSESAKIVYCTVGILLRMLVCPKEADDDYVETEEAESDSFPLSNVSHVVIDEVHERDVNTDFVLTLLRRLLSINKTIRIILMSATASAQLFVNYFNSVGMTPTVIDIPGRSFPVDVRWISESERFAASRVQGWSAKIDPSSIDSNSNNKNLAPRATSKIDNEFIRDLIRALVKKQQADGELKASGSQRFRSNGAILVFLPGKREIEMLAKLLYQDPLVGDRSVCKILQLHSTIPRGEQQAVFVPALSGNVKIVLATNIAETSITIGDISHVIDTGRVKESRFNSTTRTKELTTVWTSQASAKQRAGRAGRTSRGTCWRLYSEAFSTNLMPDQTSAEILRTPLDELVMQLCLLFENKQDSNRSEARKGPVGVCPIRFLSNAPEPPHEDRLVEACKHLLEVGAIKIVAQEPRILYRLSPLGYHLSRLPMDAKVGKVLLVGCLLGCLDNALTVAASLSNTKSCFPSRWGSIKEVDWQICLQTRNEMIENGFGGRTWKGGTVKGDSIATIAAYRKWCSQRNNKDRINFCKKHGIDNLAMVEMSSLRSQFMDCLQDAGFIEVDGNDEKYNSGSDDALLTSCCLVAGLYPNVCTLMRPRKGGPKGGRLLTKDGDICKASMGSFQAQRVRNVSESGKDAYGVFHSKHRTVGTGERPGECFLSEIDFISRYALLLFGGDMVVEKNALIVDGWLKFKVGDKGSATGALLTQELRSELDTVMLRHIVSRNDNDESYKEDSDKVILMVRKLLEQE